MKYIIITGLLFLTGCGTLQNTTLPTEQLFCPKDTVEFCEGRNPHDLECVCVNKRVLDRQLRNLIINL